MALPGIPDPTLEPESLRSTLVQMKQAIEILGGVRGSGNPLTAIKQKLNSAVTWQDLINLGVVQSPNNLPSSNFGPWINWVPTISVTGGGTQTSTAFGRYTQIGKLVALWFEIDFTALAGTITVINWTMPVPVKSYGALNAYGVGRETSGFTAVLTLAGGIVTLNGGNFSLTAPCSVKGSLVYEAA